MFWNKTTHSSDEQDVSDQLKKLDTLLKEGQDHAVNLEKEFDKYTQELYSQRCTSTTDAQSSTGWFSWILSPFSHRKTEPDHDQISSNKLEEGMRNSLKKNKEWVSDCQKSLQYLSKQKLLKSTKCLEHQNQQLLQKPSELKDANGKTLSQSGIWTLLKSPFKVFFPSQTQQVTFQLYCHQTSDLVQSIIAELTKQLKSSCFKNGITLKEDILDSALKIKLNLPVVVICLRTSRLSPDFFDAIRDVTPGPNVAVLLVHNKDIFALPTGRSDAILPKNKYKEMGAIIDVAFGAGKRMYKCDMNAHAINTLTLFIKKMC